MYNVYTRADGWFVVVNVLEKIVGYSLFKNLHDAESYCQKLNSNQMIMFAGRYVKNLLHEQLNIGNNG